jgi:hypothetical protein
LLLMLLLPALVHCCGSSAAAAAFAPPLQVYPAWFVLVSSSVSTSGWTLSLYCHWLLSCQHYEQYCC